jgi:vacuolar-type H+-ATPase catalytic subunit A/Vma1
MEALAALSIIALVVAVLTIWGLSAEKARRRKPPSTATLEQVAALDEVLKNSVEQEVDWLEDGTALLYASMRE